MTSDLAAAAPERGGVRHLLTAAWGAITGVAPHVLHHVGPLAGAAVLAGAGGRLVFFVLGLAVTVPTLRRLRRRFGNWVAPGLALGLFAATFAMSTFVVGPLITESDEQAAAFVVTEDHDAHGH